MKFEHILAWHFIASRNDDEIYAYGTRFHAKQFCKWLNYYRTSDRYTYSEIATYEIPEIEHMMFWLRGAIYTKELPPSVNGVSPSTMRESAKTIITAASHPFPDKAQIKAEILLVVGAIIEWNCHHTKPNKFAITQLLLERVTGFNNLAIRDVLVNQQQVINLHYASLGWEKAHDNNNCKKKDFEDLLDFIRGVLQPL